MSTDFDAYKRIGEFMNDGSGQGVWTAIRKDEVAQGLSERIVYKDGLNQHGTGLCAVASLVHAELQDDPLSFVELAIGLYKTGRAAWRGQVVQPNLELQRNPPPDGLIVNGTALTFNRADWIVMSSIRNTINPADHYSPTSSDGTALSALEAFIRGVGYTKVDAAYNSNSFSKGLGNVHSANELLQHGYRVLLNINAVMLDSETQADWGGGAAWGLAPKPNHIVQLVEPIQIYPIDAQFDLVCRSGAETGLDPDLVVCAPPFSDPDMPILGGRDNAVRFAVYTWADGHRRVPEDPRKDLKLKDFLWNYYGFVAFKD